MHPKYEVTNKISFCFLKSLFSVEANLKCLSWCKKYCKDHKQYFTGSRTENK